MSLKLGVWLMLSMTALISLSSAESFQRAIRFMNSRPTENDEKRCTVVPVLDKRLYITSLQPDTERSHAHHMVLIGCRSRVNNPSTLDPYGNSWRCDQDGDSMCGDDDDDHSEKVLFTWALNGNGFTFPENVGYRIGRDAEINWLVLQIHYAKAIPEGDNSGLIITITPDDLPFQAATYILGSDGFVPPRSEEFHLESACVLDLPYEITPLAYRVHSHHLGDVTSAYVIRNDHWTEIGRMSPRQPEQYYMATNQDLLLEAGDVIASRCTMSSLSRDTPTFMGHRNIDEMCVFYMLYYTSYKPNIQDTECFNNAQEFSWMYELRDLGVKSDPPSDASNLDGVQLIRPTFELDREELAHLRYPKKFFH